mgnify:CR=1 FL=1
MEKGTSTSKKNLIEKLHYAAKLVKEKYGVSIWFAEIMGKRWSYLAGQTEGETSPLPPERIELNNRFGVVSDRWEDIPVNERERIVSSLKDIIG